MIDIETLGNGPTSVIKSIGVVQFDLDSGVGEKAEYVVNIDSCLKAGLTVDGSTIEWWMSQSDKARAVFDQTGEDLREVLWKLHDFIKTNAESPIMWCNGANFDFPILDNAFRACEVPSPWPYYATRDYRTIKAITPKHLRVEPEVAHSAVADALAQAASLQNMWRWMNEK